MIDISIADLIELLLAKADGEPHNRYAIHCPFHKELTPSCILDPDAKTYHCLGCGKKGPIEEIHETLQ